MFCIYNVKLLAQSLGRPPNPVWLQLDCTGVIRLPAALSGCLSNFEKFHLVRFQSDQPVYVCFESLVLVRLTQ